VIGSLSPPADAAIIPPSDASKLGPEDKVGDLTAIPVAKVLEQLPRMPDINPDAIIQADEFYGIIEFDAWTFENGDLEEIGNSFLNGI